MDESTVKIRKAKRGGQPKNVFWPTEIPKVQLPENQWVPSTLTAIQRRDFYARLQYEAGKMYLVLIKELFIQFCRMREDYPGRVTRIRTILSTRNKGAGLAVFVSVMFKNPATKRLVFQTPVVPWIQG